MPIGIYPHKSNKKKCICEWCHKEFETFPSRPGRFCSAQCRCEFGARQPRGHVVKPERGGKATWYCKQCGKEMRTYKSRVQDTCSNKCSWLYFPKKRLRVINCENCGLEFTVKPFEIFSLGRRFCSMKCKHEAQSAILRNQNREVKEYVRGPNWERQSRAAKQRDHYTCQSCYNEGVDAHHIKPYRTFNGDWKHANDLSNLVTLCKSCHNKIEHGLLPCPQPRG